MDISKQNINIECPDCKKSLSVTIKQVADEIVINCDCGQEIQLRDKNGASKKAIKDIDNSLKALEKTIFRLGK